jgi:dethiobiotin synthetase
LEKWEARKFSLTRPILGERWYGAMAIGFFVTGTDTGVGKTLVAAALLHAFRRAGKSTVGMKPIAAGAQESERGLHFEDVEALIAASSVQAPRELVNLYGLRAPIAPHIAAYRRRAPGRDDSARHRAPRLPRAVRDGRHRDR